MNISTFFKLLKAPLKNTRWSWGATRPDGKVVLRIASHDIFADGWAYLYAPENALQVGGRERAEHVALISGNCPAFLVVCQITINDGKDHIDHFDKRELWCVTQVEDRNGHIYGKLSHRVAAGELL